MQKEACVPLQQAASGMYGASAKVFASPNNFVGKSINERYFKSRDSSVAIALGYGLDDRGSKFRFPAEAGNFSLRHCVQNGSGTHPTSNRYQGLFPWG
jgi:hypothetical protein